ncbi:MAG TPA: hypothetical protein VL354_19355 [Spirochaetia bacterium]|nr:hypothetical protein [Spirochaetia bacterium]
MQRRIFADHGLVSSVALSPLVPVAFLSKGEPRRGLLATLNASVKAPYRIELGGLSWEEGWLYLCVDSGGVWSTLRAAALEGAHPREAEAAPGLFPAHEGFFLGCFEARRDHHELIRPHVPTGGFTSSVLSLLRIDAAADGDAWWRSVSVEVLDEVPLRGRRAL